MNGEARVLDRSAAGAFTRALDFIELMKPELTLLSVLTALCGFYLAGRHHFDAMLFLHTGLGTLLIGGGAGALNQFIERKYDALMKRTERRPLPSGRLLPSEALVFGIAISAAGIIELSVFTNVLTGFLGALTWGTYLFLYTPLKRVTPFATVIGGIPGAIPPMMGWTAVRNDITPEAWVLFAILFCWQMPHFFSLAWMYRKDYARAGFKILTVADGSGERTSRHILFYLIALIPASLGPAYFGLTGLVSAVGALALGLAFLATGILFLRLSGSLGHDLIGRFNPYARRIFLVSLLYLPALMLLFTLDKI